MIPTYNSPRELEFILCSLGRQTRLPDEVLIADDGSGEETKALIQSWVEKLPFPIRHCWHADRGFRKSRIVNEAVRQSTGDFLLFIDGDTFPHRRWIEDYVRAAPNNTVLCGRRVKLGPKISETISFQKIEAGAFDSLNSALLFSSIMGDTKRLSLGIRLPSFLCRVLHPRSRKLMGVNFGLSREAFFAVNGYDEEWKVYGCEDRGLELCLRNSGYTLTPLLNRAVVFHVYHPERPRSAEAHRLIRAQEGSCKKRCVVGIERTTEFATDE
ncbi:MAG: glycosyltransferase [Planctomycetota bacterium]|nr:glycosyltransferase [Planctomycetota bacterium]